MTTPILKIKVLAKPVIKGKMDVRFPGLVQATSPILLDKTSGVFTFSMDINALAGMLQNFFQPNELVVQTFTAGGTEIINANTGIALVNQTVGAAKALTMPLSTAKTCPVLISDFKGDAGTNNITVNLSGSDKFPGGLTSWKIAADTGSILLRPISGVGYTL